MPTLSSEYVTRLGKDIFIACGASEQEASAVIEHLVTASLMGLASHGLIRIPQYVGLVEDGTIKPGAAITLEKDMGSTLIVNCGYTFGMYGANKATQIAIERAKKHGISCVLTKNCNHIGRVGAYPQMAAEAGMICIAANNSPKHGHFVSPFGGKQGRLAPNPIAFAAPTNGDPIVMDMSTCAISEGMVRVCLNRQEPVPEGCIVDADGKPTTDPKKFYGPPKGSILPFGGVAGYKGTALAMMAELLASTLLGYHITQDGLAGNGLCLQVIDISRFLPLDAFKHNADEMVAYIKSSPPAEGSSGVSVPGELNFASHRKCMKEGIELDDNTWGQITETAEKYKVRI